MEEIRWWRPPGREICSDTGEKSSTCCNTHYQVTCVPLLKVVQVLVLCCSMLSFLVSSHVLPSVLFLFPRPCAAVAGRCLNERPSVRAPLPVFASLCFRGGGETGPIQRHGSRSSSSTPDTDMTPHGIPARGGHISILSQQEEY